MPYADSVTSVWPPCGFGRLAKTQEPACLLFPGKWKKCVRGPGTPSPVNLLLPDGQPVLVGLAELLLECETDDVSWGHL